MVLVYDLKNRKFATHEPNISLLAVSEEARETALQIVPPSFNTVGSSRIIYIDVEQDKIFLGPGRYGDLGQILLPCKCSSVHPSSPFSENVYIF